MLLTWEFKSRWKSRITNSRILFWLKFRRRLLEKWCHHGLLAQKFQTLSFCHDTFFTEPTEIFNIISVDLRTDYETWQQPTFQILFFYFLRNTNNLQFRPRILTICAVWQPSLEFWIESLLAEVLCTLNKLSAQF